MEREKDWSHSIEQSLVIDPQEIGRHVMELRASMTLAEAPGEEVGPYSYLKPSLNERIIGQEDAVDALVSALNHSEFGDPDRPIGTFIFLGPTGVGKSQTAKEIAKLLHDGSEGAFLNINCTQFKSNGDIGVLQGAPPGYIGHDQPALFDEKKIHQPKSVILFDEVEKAHPTFHNFLMQIMDEGEISIFNDTKKVSLKDSLIILTSNAGSTEINEQLTKKSVGFQSAEKQKNEPLPKEKLTEIALSALEKTFKPEFLGRIEDKVLFTHLTDEQHSLALEQYVKSINERKGYRARGIQIESAPELRQYIVENTPRRRVGGFREVRTSFRQAVERELEQRILSGKIPNHSMVIALPAGKASKEKNPNTVVDFHFQSLSTQKSIQVA